MDTAKNQDTFLTLDKSSSGIYKEKGSKFFYFAIPVTSEEEVKAELQSLKKAYFDASHHCYAWVLGPKGMNFRTADDGEPNHSAGDPILGQIRSKQLTNILIVVVRYFGGTKLGISGLIHAYRTSAALAIEENKIVEKKVMLKISVEFSYMLMNEVMKIVKLENLEITRQELELDCRLDLSIRESILSRVKSKLLELESVKIKVD